MTWYSNGTVDTTANSAVVRGTNTWWMSSGLRAGDMLLIGYSTASPRGYEIKSIDNDVQITLVMPFPVAASGAPYVGIPMLSGDRTAITMTLATQISKAFTDNQAMAAVWQAFYTGNGTVTLTMPDGTKVTGSSFNKLTDDISKKADSSSLGTAAKKNTGSSFGDVLTVGTSGLADQAVEWNGTAGSGFNRLSSFPPSTDTSYNCVHMKVGGYACQIAASLGGMPRLFVRNTLNGGSDLGWRECYTTGNTTKATDGTLKAASPIVKIFTDGRSETNDESDGCTVKRLDVGKYLIEGCIGMNADASWGGIDGGFDIPKDRNGQQLIWLDYDVHADGSILVKTFHRTYPEAPAFAQNLIGYRDQETGAFVETVHTGNAVDIPAEQFVSVRVEMSTNGKDAAANDIKAAIEEAILEEKSHEQGS